MLFKSSGKRNAAVCCLQLLRLHSHLALWHRQVEAAENLQLAVRATHILALDGAVILSRRRRLQVGPHVPLLELRRKRGRASKAVFPTVTSDLTDQQQDEGSTSPSHSDTVATRQIVRGIVIKSYAQALIL